MISREKLDGFCKAAAELCALVIGDVMLDQYLRGTADRTSPEAPVPILDLRDRTRKLGGAANVALNLADFCGEVHLIGISGKDQGAKDFQQMCALERLKAHLVEIEGRKTTVKTRLLAGENHLLRVDDEDTDPLERAYEDAVLVEVDSVIRESTPDLVIVQDYNKGMLTPRVIAGILTRCRFRGIFVAVDPKFEHSLEYKNVALFKPNFLELESMVPFKISRSKSDLKKAASYIHERIGCDVLMVTLSADGIFISGPDAESVIQPPEAITVVDVCGAGDAVIAVSALAQVIGWSYLETAIISNLVGGIVCGLSGVHPISKSLLLGDKISSSAST